MKENGVDVKNTNIFVVGNKSDLKSKVKFILIESREKISKKKNLI
jgi:hypothetical protein